MNQDNRWIKMEDCISWDEFERKYSGLFENNTGHVAKPLRMALGSLFIKSRYQYADRESVLSIFYRSSGCPVPNWEDQVKRQKWIKK